MRGAGRTTGVVGSSSFCAKLPEYDWVLLKRSLEERKGGAGENTRLTHPGERVRKQIFEGKRI